MLLVQQFFQTKNGDIDNETQNIYLLDNPQTSRKPSTTPSTTIQPDVQSPTSTIPPTNGTAIDEWYSYRSVVVSLTKNIGNEQLIIDVFALVLVITLICILTLCFILCYAYIRTKRALAHFLELAFALQIKFPAVRHWMTQGDAKTFRSCKKIAEYTNMRRGKGAQIIHDNQLDDNAFYTLTQRTATPPPPPPSPTSTL
jgi:hypothetical protein